MEDKSTDKDSKPQRRERVPFHQSRSRLNVQAEKGVERDYVFRWFNDKGDRLDRAENGGWLFVTEAELKGSVGEKEVHGGNTDLHNRVSKVVGTNDDNSALRAYLMKLHKQFHKEDQKAKAAIFDKVDEAIRAGQSGGASVANQYGDVNMTNRRQ